MPLTSTAALAAARGAIANPMGYDQFLGKLGAKDRLAAERHVAACEADSDAKHASLWKRLARTLMTLAPHAARFASQHTAQFYVPDGRFRLQAFALEDQRDGSISVYVGDVLDEAVRAGVLKSGGPMSPEPGTIQARIGSGAETLAVERLDARSTALPEFYKHMLGWNRRAVRVVLPTSASAAQAEAVELLCAMAVGQLTAGQRPAAKSPAAVRVP
jgi:hypothetical protein